MTVSRAGGHGFYYVWRQITIEVIKKFMIMKNTRVHLIRVKIRVNHILNVD